MMCKMNQRVIGLLFIGFIFMPGCLIHPKNGSSDHSHSNLNHEMTVNKQLLIDQRVQKMADQIAACLDQDTKVAVTGIHAMNSQVNGFCIWLAERLTGALANYPHLKVLERSRVQDILAEQGLSMDNLFDQENNPLSIGQFKNADVLVQGTVHFTNLDHGRFDISIQVIECNTAQIKSGCSLTEWFPQTDRLSELWFTKSTVFISVYPKQTNSMIYIDGQFVGSTDENGYVLPVFGLSPGMHTLRVTASGFQDFHQNFNFSPLKTYTIPVRLFQPLSVRFWQVDTTTGHTIGDQGVVYSGRSYQFCFSSNQDCYVYVINKGTTGNLCPLIPNDHIMKNNFISGNTTMCIPPSGGFPLEGPPGKEFIYVIASVKPLQNVADIIHRLKTSQGTNQDNQSLDHLQTYQLTKDYRHPRKPSMSESLALTKDHHVCMTLTYHHQENALDPKIDRLDRKNDNNN